MSVESEPPHPPSAGIISAVANGHAEAFDQLYQRHSPIAYRLLLRMLGNPADAQEVLQEVFFQVWSRARSFDVTRGSEVAWIVTIARSRALDRLRSASTRQARENEASNDAVLPGVVNGSEQDVLSMERRLALRAALSTLPENQRVALELAYFEGLSQSEIAIRLAEPLGTIKTRIALGMRKLRDQLDRRFSQ